VSPRNAYDRDVLDFFAWKTWLTLSREQREKYLDNAWCSTCKVTSFASGWTIATTRFSVVIKGTCSKCGRPISRVISSGRF